MHQEVIVVGNVGREPELRLTLEGNPICSFSLATNRRWTNSDGSPGEETTWFQVSVRGKLAETCNQLLSTGRQVMVEGRLISDLETGGPRVWLGQDGQPRASYSLRATSVHFLGSGAGELPDEVKFGEPVQPPPRTNGEKTAADR